MLNYNTSWRTEMPLNECPCGSGEYLEAQYDEYGIFLCYTCSQCEKEKLSHYRSDIFDQYDCEEQIEEDY
jgi:hypothetical protein